MVFYFTDIYQMNLIDEANELVSFAEHLPLEDAIPFALSEGLAGQEENVIEIAKTILNSLENNTIQLSVNGIGSILVDPIGLLKND